MDLCQDSQDFSDYSSILSSEKNLSELSEQNILGSESSANQSMLISESSIISENILEEVKESKVNTEYPNLVYAEFMTLITKYKIQQVSNYNIQLATKETQNFFTNYLIYTYLYIILGFIFKIKKNLL